MTRKIRSALISVYHKDKLKPIIDVLQKNNVQLFSTGGTLSFLQEQGFSATPVEELTAYPSIFGGRVKTLHPKIFGGILFRRDEESDISEAGKFEIPAIDLVIVDLYPFEETVASGASADDIIEKIDIGGISLIRAAAKNFNDVLIISSRNQYDDLLSILLEQNCSSTTKDRKQFATYAFNISSHYDSVIFNYFNEDNDIPLLKLNISNATSLRYGENPHQQAQFHGNLDSLFDQLNGKALSYNNLVDLDAGLNLIAEFEGNMAFAILKHTNACGLATGHTAIDAYTRAFEADTLSAFGGVLVSNATIDIDAAEVMNSLFFEILIAPEITPDALELLKKKKNRIILKLKNQVLGTSQHKTLLNGIIEQDRDIHIDNTDDLTIVTIIQPTPDQLSSMLFASKICKHTKSNAIVLARDGQMLSSGVGQTSRIDALNQAIAKARQFGFDLKGASMASDAFFPFPDSVEVAHTAGISSVIQPGGSVKDQLSIDYCNNHGMTMVFTGFRHFKH